MSNGLLEVRPGRVNFCIRVILIACLILQAQVYGKRRAVEYADKVIVAGVEYKAVYEYKEFFQKAFIEAKDLKTEKILWKVLLYKIKLNPSLEADVQWVMISKVVGSKDVLYISDEKKNQYNLNLKSHVVKKVK